MDKQAYIQRTADWARLRGFNEIRANIEGFDKPITYDRRTDGQSFTPDVTGKEFGRKSYFEVINDTDEASRVISKLKLLSQLAAIKGGQLYIMVPKNQLQFAKRILLDSLITAEIVNLH